MRMSARTMRARAITATSAPTATPAMTGAPPVSTLCRVLLEGGHETANFPFCGRPTAAWLRATAAPQLANEFPIGCSLASERGLGHPVRSAEAFDVAEQLSAARWLARPFGDRCAPIDLSALRGLYGGENLGRRSKPLAPMAMRPKSPMKAGLHIRATLKGRKQHQLVRAAALQVGNTPLYVARHPDLHGSAGASLDEIDDAHAAHAAGKVTAAPWFSLMHSRDDLCSAMRT
jgi:hypothetical protein